MPTIHLTKKTWTFDESVQIGPSGGFGQVFLGQGDIGEVAIKRLKMTAQAAAYREMKIGASLIDRELAHVVPVLDFGQDANSDRYFLVMPKCDHSLQGHLNAKTPLPWDETKPVILDIISGLKEVGEIVHRDLKPGNILWHEGRWRIADFGIAKFVEDSTSLETLRTSLTPLYGAPEQWLGERPTRATDIYALGCIIHTVFNGRPPFIGDNDEVREAHLSKAPPELNGADPRINGLVSMMLRKVGASRPSLDRCDSIVKSVDANAARAKNSELAAAGHAVAQEQARIEAAERSVQAIRNQRLKLAKEAIADLKSIFGKLFDEIQATAIATSRAANAIVLGPAHLTVTDPTAIENFAPGRPTEAGWDVAAFSKMNLRASFERRSDYEPAYYNFNASLIYSTTPKDSDFRWRELSFWNFTTSGDQYDKQVALEPRAPEFALALSKVMSGWQIAHGPFTIDGENEGDFMDRWLLLFARAAQGKLRPSNYMPLPDSYFR